MPSGVIGREDLSQFCKASGLGDEPRQVFDEIAQIKMVDAILRTRTLTEIRCRCIAEPTKAQKAKI
jgi:hypothetical protein